MFITVWSVALRENIVKDNDNNLFWFIVCTQRLLLYSYMVTNYTFIDQLTSSGGVVEYNRVSTLGQKMFETNRIKLRFLEKRYCSWWD